MDDQFFNSSDEDSFLKKSKNESNNIMSFPNNGNIFEDEQNDKDRDEFNENQFNPEGFFINDKNNLEMNENNRINQIENDNNNKEVNTYTLKTGKIINTINATISNAMIDLFQNDYIDYESKKDMQLLKIKKRRRKKKEIKEEKEKKIEEKKERKKGRIKIGDKEKENISLETHSKYSDDNILKKINSYYFSSLRDWLNNSFLDEKGVFLPEQKNKFLRLNSSITRNNLKKSEITELMEKSLKDIFSSEISCKNKKNSNKYHNKELIEEIYKTNKQIFIIYILNLKFIEGIHIFNGQTSYEQIKDCLKKENIDEKQIEVFYNRFNKINNLLNKIYDKEKDKIYDKEKGEESYKKLQEYSQRIGLLSVNYEKWFERKYNRNNKAKNTNSSS